jgi:hypothetical protein
LLLAKPLVAAVDAVVVAAAAAVAVTAPSEAYAAAAVPTKARLLILFAGVCLPDRSRAC